jgi:hypothetical protein
MGAPILPFPGALLGPSRPRAPVPVRDSMIAAIAARGWMQRQLESPADAGVTRLDAARRMLEQWDRIRTERGKVTQYVRTK